MNNAVLEKYAGLVVRTGLNIRKGQTLVITSLVECAPFARMVAEEAYKAGARDVVMNWGDELLAKLRFVHAPEEVLDEFPQWQRDFFDGYARQGAAFLAISAGDPDVFKTVDPARVMRSQKAKNTALRDYMEKVMSNKVSWCVVSVPTTAWAAKVFAGVPAEEAVEKLWDAIIRAVRVDGGDPAAAWANHKNNLDRSREFLTSRQFKYLKFKNSAGTDLTVELPAGHIWVGGSSRRPDGVEFFPNMPTEEVFTMPKKTGVNGVVVSSRPLNLRGSLIDGFRLVFEDGKVTQFSARQGEAVLQKLLESDEGASYLGEVALVPFDSPISRSNVIFYNTLFDENASCHLALGRAYPLCIRGGEEMTREELAARGANDSLVHEDFMIGTADLDIVGITAAGEEVRVFKNGNYAF